MIDFADYIKFVENLAGKDLNFSEPRALHAILGISGEAGELVGAIKRTIVYHEPLDRQNLKEELGDLLYYVGLLMSDNDWTLDEVLRENMSKLQKRYPDGYNNEDAVARKDKQDEACRLGDESRPSSNESVNGL